jgi:hypothetical protein
MRRRRFRTWAKWACTLAAVLSSGAALFGLLLMSRIFRVPLWATAALFLLCSGSFWFFLVRARRREMVGRCRR